MNIIAVFAHPDDEAFGPSGTIAKLAKDNNVILLCATRGEAGEHHDPAEQARLAQIREKELENSAKILGVKQIHFLGFKDGELCNNLYHKLAESIEHYCKKYQPGMLITTELRGISGHLDHIAVALTTTYVFYRLPYIKELYYYCLTEDRREQIEDYFIYFPKGYNKSDIDLTNDISDVWEQKINSIRAHESQKKDGTTIISRLQKLPKAEHFQILKK
ncbi:hypothetical protein A3C23_04700 [Candidatus Roizmanbacteria bacterium RIFCSPHIGHO2_02_FULL_37_13b]|uniref:GlcNAc-PI de-N-acetylase n=1 Tax=Candidatus Roizmanbacteria bacterium RIFCSPLOWO2_02_FULL_36_11 TaxID=1802071 RepID=A0A1F7JHC7_9BACT|nr:MAG: hypothetical protein A3C23_04700 [Candidatus Roizmanbacteria bacterium RIFCSPHIGHO2_02_FULL_37_13b]OGK55007.1 MAG: hypothetical protein A3H78_00845 [Candidatus Roizmanbacteria bacterium RIFCSPLOWO2_02_FULL_36_11]